MGYGSLGWKLKKLRCPQCKRTKTVKSKRRNIQRRCSKCNCWMIVVNEKEVIT